MTFKYVQILEATPRGVGRPFPIDMLRYDGCRPATEADSNKITASITDRNVESVELNRYIAGKKEAPTYERWHSFGWNIQIKEVRPLA